MMTLLLRCVLVCPLGFVALPANLVSPPFTCLNWTTKYIGRFRGYSQLCVFVCVYKERSAMTSIKDFNDKMVKATFLQRIHEERPKLTREDEQWGIFSEIKVCLKFHLCPCCAVCNDVLYSTAINKKSIVNVIGVTTAHVKMQGPPKHTEKSPFELHVAYSTKLAFL